MKASCFLLALLLWASHGLEAGAQAPRIESKRGGWQGGFSKLYCFSKDERFEAVIFDGQAFLYINGDEFIYKFLTFIPEGFVMSAWIGGRFVTYRAEMRKKIIKITHHDAPGGIKETDLFCELCDKKLDQTPRQELGLIFSLPDGEWCPRPISDRFGKLNVRFFVRRVLDLRARQARDGTLTSAEDGHIFVAALGVGGTRSAGQKIASGADLREFIEEQMNTGRMSAKQMPGWVTILLGPYEGQAGYKDLVVDSWKFLPDPDKRYCATIELRMLLPSGDRSFRQRRRACVHAERWVAFAGSFSDTRLTDDSQADRRASKWEAHAEHFLNSIRFRD